VPLREQAAVRRGDRREQRGPEGERPAGRGEVVQPGRRPGLQQGLGGEPGRREQGKPAAGQQGGQVPAGFRYADQQPRPRDGEGGGAERGRAGPPPAQGGFGDQDEDRRGPDGEKGGQADPDQRDRREVAGLDDRGEATERGAREDSRAVGGGPASRLPARVRR